MSWKKYFKPVNGNLPTSNSGGSGKGLSNSKYSSWLPEVYEGPSDRLARYQVYETMDFDHEIHAALDTIADFSTENDAQTKQPFIFEFHTEPTPTEVNIITKALRQWCVLNEISKRQWSMFRSTLKYGDQVFIRDPETYKLYWVDPNKVTKVIVNESEGKDPEAYVIKDLDLNIGSLIATNQHSNGRANTGGAGMMFSAPHNGATNYSNPKYGQGSSDSQFAGDGETMVDAKHIVHLTLCDGMTASWPFGTSILEQVYKVYKQKELLEDSIIIYRVHRAPERRIFYIDVGQMPPNKAKQHLEQVKYDIQQKRIPSRSGGGASMTDATYNPMSALEDYYIAVTSEGRGSKVETLPGGENLGDIDDLRYFNNKMMRALGVPSSYLPTGPEDGTASYNDGRVGTAFIQEFRFAKVCQRYQKQIAKTFDKEFKMFLKYKGVEIDNSLFTLCLPEPQSFSEYRQLELDAAKINVFASMSEIPYMSKRFALKRYLGLSEEEMMENEKLWKEENTSSSNGKAGDAKGDLSAAGITSSGIDGITPEGGFEDIDDIGDSDMDDEMDSDGMGDISDDDIDNFGN